MKSVIIFLMISISSIYSFSQVKISSVFGVNLGDSETTVVSSLKSQGKSGKWLNDKKGVRYYQISSPVLGICKFDVANFLFDLSGKLKAVIFSSNDGYAGNPNFSEQQSNYYNSCLNSASVYKKIFNTMRSDLSDKYGTPNIDDEERVIWKSNGNLIELFYSFEEDKSSPFCIFSTARVYVKYSKNNNSSNY